MTAWSCMTVSGGPSATTRPSAMTTTQSAMWRTMCMSCSTNSTVMPRSLRSRMWSSSDSVSAGLTPAIGSSSITSVGSLMSARAISSSLRWPPESDGGEVVGLGVELEALRAARAPCSSISSSCVAPERRDEARPEPLAALPGRAELHVLEHRQQRQRLGELERAHLAHARDLEGRDAGERLAVERPRAAVGLVEAAQQVEQRRLAGAVGADERGDGAARDLEVLDVDGGEAAEAAGHVVDDHDRVGLGDAGHGIALGETAGLGAADAARGRRRPAPRPGCRCSRCRYLTKVSSLLLPRMPCGRKITSSMSATPTRMKRSVPAWIDGHRQDAGVRERGKQVAEEAP